MLIKIPKKHSLLEAANSLKSAFMPAIKNRRPLNTVWQRPDNVVQMPEKKFLPVILVTQALQSRKALPTAQDLAALYVKALLASGTDKDLAIEMAIEQGLKIDWLLKQSNQQTIN